MESADGIGGFVPMKETETVNLLWTGGWDSTFRFLGLMLLHDCDVQPWYIMNATRPSLRMEIHTMNRIKRMVFERRPESRGRLRATGFRAVDDIPHHDEVTARFYRLKSVGHLGNQYNWLARFAEDAGMTDLELAIHKDDKAHSFLESFVVPGDGPNGGPYRLREDVTDPDLRLFRYFHFPLFDLTKLEMQERAADHGFLDIMEETWFCHNPLANDSACGVCTACRYTIEEGMGRRVPRAGRMKYWTSKVVGKARRSFPGARRSAASRSRT